MQTPVTLRNKVTEEFGKSAQNYHKEATIQKKVAEGLVASLRPWKDMLPVGPILEIGAGTGFLSSMLIEEFPEREFEFTDGSEKMIQFLEEKLGDEDKFNFSVLDANDLGSNEPKYSLIVSNFAVQWFENPEIALEKIGEMLLPGGLLLFTFPGDQSFEEWYSCCLELGLPFTANPMPNVEEVIIKLSLGPFQIDYYENDLYQYFEHSMEFFKHLKSIGASKSLNNKALSYKQIKLLSKFWDQKIKGAKKVKWHIVYVAAKKDVK